jgi:hypothetical protein
MKAALRQLFSFDFSGSVEDYRPDDPFNFSISMRAMIGPAEEAGSDSFDLWVCTPAWLATTLEKESCVWGTHTMVVECYDPLIIRSAIERFISACSGSDWTDLARKLNEMAKWEFDSYQS